MGLLGSLGGVIGTFTGAPWLGAIGSGLDSFLDKKSSQQGQQDANEWNAQQAAMNRDFQAAQSKQQMDFQERMRGTQYQTAVKDMAAAGLNPMLAYSQGGAGTPSGASASGSQSAPALNKMSAGISSAQQSAQTAQALQSLELNKAQIDNIQAQTAKTASETLDNNVNTALALAQTRNLSSTASNTDIKTQLNKDAYQADLQTRQVAAQRASQDYSREGETFNADVARRKAESTLTQMEIPKSQADAKFWNDFKDAPQILKLIMQIFGTSHSAASILRR